MHARLAVAGGVVLFAALLLMEAWVARAHAVLSTSLP
jgi:hypothetical protein